MSSTHTQTHTDTHKHTQTHINTHRYTQTHIDTHRHTQTHTQTHRHTQTHTDRSCSRPMTCVTCHTHIITHDLPHTWHPHVCSKVIRNDTAQEWTNRTPNATNESIVHFLLLPGSQSSFTEITEYMYFSLVWSVDELQYKN